MRKQLSKEQRVRIYQEALRTFRIMAERKNHKEHVTGMCEHISRAVIKLRFNRKDLVTRYSVDLTKSNFPEYFSYKPKRGWLDECGDESGYWWSTETPRGRERRLKILEALAEGKDKSMTGTI